MPPAQRCRPRELHPTLIADAGRIGRRWPPPCRACLTRPWTGQLIESWSGFSVALGVPWPAKGAEAEQKFQGGPGRPARSGFQRSLARRSADDRTSVIMVNCPSPPARAIPTPFVSPRLVSRDLRHPARHAPPGGSERARSRRARPRLTARDVGGAAFPGGDRHLSSATQNAAVTLSPGSIAVRRSGNPPT